MCSAVQNFNFPDDVFSYDIPFLRLLILSYIRGDGTSISQPSSLKAGLWLRKDKMDLEAVHYRKQVKYLCILTSPNLHMICKLNYRRSCLEFTLG